MKKLCALIIFLIILTIFVSADDQFSVRFHSFGENTTINLKEFLGESKQYIVSKTTNVRVIINHENGTAFLSTKGEWEGSETIVFTSIEKSTNLTNQTLIDMLKTAEEFKYEITSNEINEIISENLDKKIKDRLTSIKPEELENLYSRIENKKLFLDLNNEVNLTINFQEEKPSMKMEFLTPREPSLRIAIPKIQKGFDRRWIIIPSTILLAIIAIIIVISKKEKIIQNIKNVEAKRKTIKELKKIKKYDKENSKLFLAIIKHFFSDFFNLKSSFVFSDLRNAIKSSNLRIMKKIKLVGFVNELSDTLNYSNTEKWAEVYGKGTIPPDRLKKLIKKAISAIKNL